MVIAAVFGVLGLLLSSCEPPSYPAYTDRAAVIAEAQKISDDLEAYVKDWLDGKVPAALPARLIPKGVDLTQLKIFRLQRLDELDPAKQWGVRPAFDTIDFNAATGYFPDKNVTYMIPGGFFAPFGSTVVIEGQFPHSRFFDVQIVPPFAPENYYYSSGFGVGEVPILDADIIPEPGSTNPFLPGADRNAAKRDYRLRFTLAIGDALALNQAMRAPFYRQPGNQRYGTGIVYQGPWAKPDSPDGHKRGVWNTSLIWLRYYGPDKAAGPLGGVPLPRIHYELPDGRPYYISCDYSAYFAQANITKPIQATDPVEPTLVSGNSEASGWDHQFSIFRSIFTGVARNSTLRDRRWVRDFDLGVSGHDETAPAPNN